MAAHSETGVAVRAQVHKLCLEVRTDVRTILTDGPSSLASAFVAQRAHPQRKRSNVQKHGSADIAIHVALERSREVHAGVLPRQRAHVQERGVTNGGAGRSLLSVSQRHVFRVATFTAELDADGRRLEGAEDHRVGHSEP
jgi:hypothetical protein